MSTYTNEHIRIKENISRLRNPGNKNDGLCPDRVIFSNAENIYYGTLIGEVSAAQQVLTDIKVEGNLAQGESNTIDGKNSFAGGSQNDVVGNNSFVFGEKSKAISKNSTVIGKESSAGLKGWYYSAIDFDASVVYLAETQPVSYAQVLTSNIPDQVLYLPGFDSGLSTGDNIAFVNGQKYEDSAAIQSVDGNKLSVSSFPFISIASVDLSDMKPDDFSIYCLDKQDLSSPGIDVGGMSFALGQESNAKDYKSFVWNGKNDEYASHGDGTFSVNPTDGANGFYVGNDNLSSIIMSIVQPLEDRIDELELSIQLLNSRVDWSKTIIEFDDGTISSYDWNGEISKQTFVDNGLFDHDSAEWLSNFINVKIGTNITNIENLTFAKNNSLSSIVILDNVTSIKYNAFAQCNNLKNVILLANNTANIGNGIFYKCSNLTSITCNNINFALFSLAFFKDDSEQAAEVTFTNQNTSTIEQWFKNMYFGYSWATNHGINVICTDGVVHAKYDEDLHEWTLTIAPPNK